MKLPQPLEQGKFLKRYKRFFADINYQGDTVVAHVPNTGSLKDCLEENSPCRMTFNDDPKRKLKYTLQLIKTKSSWVGVNTGLANDLVWEAYQNQSVDNWKAFTAGKREVKISDKTRFDLALWPKEYNLDSSKKIPLEEFSQRNFHFIEVKNVTMADGDIAFFPDAVTTRGQKHLRELIELIEQGHTCELVFVIQRTDCKSFAPADDIDPEYGVLLREAQKAGLIISPYACEINDGEVKLDTSKKLKLIL